ncbi:unnamed protein product [Rangifer tarandus platyrhynchus]|uniref:Uncharacterized protein n=1 Tax=Rangifer tarandus platyrhynchus TaxID=3082113 RepID=A0ABN9A9R4_RANTA|nr:unnamed protein product [Rangifer tarandus platyrhynchus]
MPQRGWRGWEGHPSSLQPVLRVWAANAREAEPAPTSPPTPSFTRASERPGTWMSGSRTREGATRIKFISRATPRNLEPAASSAQALIIQTSSASSKTKRNKNCKLQPPTVRSQLGGTRRARRPRPASRLREEGKQNRAAIACAISATPRTLAAVPDTERRVPGSRGRSGRGRLRFVWPDSGLGGRAGGREARSRGSFPPQRRLRRCAVEVWLWLRDLACGQARPALHRAQVGRPHSGEGSQSLGLSCVGATELRSLSWCALTRGRAGRSVAALGRFEEAN